MSTFQPVLIDPTRAAASPEKALFGERIRCFVAIESQRAFLDAAWPRTGDVTCSIATIHAARDRANLFARPEAKLALVAREKLTHSMVRLGKHRQKRCAHHVTRWKCHALEIWNETSRH